MTADIRSFPAVSSIPSRLADRGSWPTLLSRENFALLCYYAKGSGKFLTDVSGQPVCSSDCLSMRPLVCPETSIRNLPLLAA